MKTVKYYNNKIPLYKYFPITDEYSVKYDNGLNLFCPNINRKDFEEENTIEKWKSIALEGKLYYTSPVFFNDPFDSALKESDEKKPTMEIRKNIIKILNSISRLSKEEANRLLYTDNFTISFLNILKQRGLDLDLMNRIYDEITKSFNTYKDEIAVCCFSEVNDSKLMWAHYTGSYAGFCIEYDFSNCLDIDFLKGIQKINYSNKRPIYGEMDIPVIENAILTTKSKEWEYEKEWRCIYKLNYEFANERIYPVLNVKNYIKAIYLGCKMSEENKKLIYDYYKDSTSVKIYEMKISQNTFDIEFEPIL